MDKLTESNLKILNIKDTNDFKRLSKSKYKFFGKYLIILCQPTDIKHDFNPLNGLNAKHYARIGYTISKKISKLATRRNKIKRRLRQLCKIISKNHYVTNFDYNIIAKSQIINTDFTDIKKDLEFCLKKLNLKINDQKN